MKNLIKISLFFILITFFISCSLYKNVTWIPLNTNKVDANKKAKTLTTVYARTYFQTRFMNVTSTVFDVITPIANGISNMNIGNSNLNSQNGLTELGESVGEMTQRKYNNDFEEKMGDFNLLSYFTNSFYSRKDSIKYFNIVLTFDKTEHTKLVNRISTYDNKKLDMTFTNELNNSNNKYISTFKFQYGIGARAGGEQFGMIKKYRPYVRIVGLIKDVNSNEFVWGNKIIVFGDKPYNGRNEAKSATGKELIEEFKIISQKLVNILINDFNGQRYSSTENLVDYVPTIDDIL